MIETIYVEEAIQNHPKTKFILNKFKLNVVKHSTKQKISKKTFEILTLESLKTYVDKIKIEKPKWVHSWIRAAIVENYEKFYNEKLSPSSFLSAFEKRKDNEIICCNDVESLKWL